MSVSRILKWARQHRKRSGKWPTLSSGAFKDAPSESWNAVDLAFRRGKRGLPSGGSLARLLATHCGIRNPKQPPPLTIAKILRWADAYHKSHGQRPTRNSGPIAEAPGETWMAVHRALQSGRRGLPGSSSLAKLLDEKRPRWRGRSEP